MPGTGAADKNRFGGRFRVIGELGAGGMGTVYHVHDEVRRCDVALKTLREIEPHALRNFKNEFRALAGMVDMNLVTLFELLSDDGQWFVTMELIDGAGLLDYVRPIDGSPIFQSADTPISTAETLRDDDDDTCSVAIPGTPAPKAAPRLPNEEDTCSIGHAVVVQRAKLPKDPALRTISGTIDVDANSRAARANTTDAENTDDPSGRTGNEGGPNRLSRRRELLLQARVVMPRLAASATQIVHGLLALHGTGNLHRDIKPSNIMVERGGRVVVCDFGLIADLSGSNSGERRLTGTPQYMSPEQASRDRLTTASDWYSVGCVLYEALTGRLPFDGAMEQQIEARLRADPPEPRNWVPGIRPTME